MSGTHLLPCRFHQSLPQTMNTEMIGSGSADTQANTRKTTTMPELESWPSNVERHVRFSQRAVTWIFLRVRTFWCARLWAGCGSLQWRVRCRTTPTAKSVAVIRKKWHNVRIATISTADFHHSDLQDLVSKYDVLHMNSGRRGMTLLHMATLDP